MTFPEDSVQTIYDTARSLITRLLDAEDPQTVATIDNLTLHEVRSIRTLCLTLHERFAAERWIPGAL